MARFARLFIDSRGVSGLIAALAMTVVAGMTALAVDVGHLYVKRAELQNAADAAALAGSAAMISYGSDLDAVRTVVVEYARRNLSEADVPSRATTAADVAFYRDGAADETSPNQVEITLGRTGLRQNPVDLFFGKVIGKDTADVTATARAMVVGACSTRCVKPFTVAAKFNWDDTAAGPTSKYTNNGQMDPASPEELASVEVLGWGPEDIGTQVVLKIGAPQFTVVPSQYNPIDLPPANRGNPVTGASAFQENIATCTGSNNVVVGPGDEIMLEPGNMDGPATQGISDLIALDPYASWDSVSNSIQGSLADDPMASPRIAYISFYDPRNPPVQGRKTIFIHQTGAVFVEGVNADGNITARFIYAMAKTPEPSSDEDCILKTVRMTADVTRGG